MFFTDCEFFAYMPEEDVALLECVVNDAVLHLPAEHALVAGTEDSHGLI